MNWQLKTLQLQDIPRCVEIEQELFAGDDPWNARAFRAEFASGAYYLGAYADDGSLLGYAGLATVGHPGTFESELHTIGVIPQAQRAGIGDGLLTALLARADELDAPVYLEVRTDNEPALALYAKYGFTRIGLRKRYYRPSGADAFTMRRPARSELAAKLPPTTPSPSAPEEVSR